MLRYERYPHSGMVPGLKRYFENGIPPGSFLTALLCNDLRETCAKADHTNRPLIIESVFWLFNEAPSGSWGSPEAFEKVIVDGGVTGIKAAVPALTDGGEA